MAVLPHVGRLHRDQCVLVGHHNPLGVYGVVTDGEEVLLARARAPRLCGCRVANAVAPRAPRVGHSVRGRVVWVWLEVVKPVLQPRLRVLIHVHQGHGLRVQACTGGIRKLQRTEVLLLRRGRELVETPLVKVHVAQAALRLCGHHLGAQRLGTPKDVAPALEALKEALVGVHGRRH